jgi:hypothetical protein
MGQRHRGRKSFLSKQDREKILMRKRRRGRQSLFLRQRWRERTTVLETEEKKERPFKTEVEKTFLMCKRRRGRQSVYSETQWRVRIRGEGEEGASFQDRVREKIFNVHETNLFFETRGTCKEILIGMQIDKVEECEVSF